MSVQAKDVKELRQRTAAGMMDCHRALSQTKGDIEKAVDLLRKQGVVKAAKRSGKSAKEGLIDVALAEDNQSGVILELNCETDFVARGDEFKAFTHELTVLTLHHNVRRLENLLKLPFKDQPSVEHAVQAFAAIVGENVQLKRIGWCSSEAGIVGAYLHHQRVGALVALNTPNQSLAEAIAMHVVAMNPIAIAPEDCPAEFLEREKQIFTEQAENSGKPSHIIDKMIQGRLDKVLKEQTLLNQPFVKDTEMTVADLLQTQQANVLNFVRYELGEAVA